MGCGSRGKGLVAEERQAPDEHVPQPGRAPPSSGHRGHPPRAHSCVRNAVTPSGSGPWAGKPTVRKAQVLSGNRMTREANAGGRKATGNRVRLQLLRWNSRITGRIQDLGVLARKGAHAGQVSLWRM